MPEAPAISACAACSARCSIYEIRPKVCRDYDPATRAEECNQCRRPHGLPDLPVQSQSS